MKFIAVLLMLVAGMAWGQAVPVSQPGTVRGVASGGNAAPAGDLTALPFAVPLSGLATQAAGTLVGVPGTAGSSQAPSALATPFSLGTSVIPTYLNAQSITATTTSGLFTFTCVTNCGNLHVGAALYGSFPGGTIVTGISGTTITTNLAASTTNASPATIQVGVNRWDSTSSVLANTIGFRQLWGGGAALGNSTWVEQYLPGQCQYGFTLPTSTACILMAPGDKIGTFVGSRTSDAAQGVQNLTLLSINDYTVTGAKLWGIYNEVRTLPGAATGAKYSFGSETSILNFNTATSSDPFTPSTNQMTMGHRVDCGNGNVGLAGLTATNCDHAIDILPNPQQWESGIIFGNGALDSSVITHPAAISMPSGANGYAFDWYSASSAIDWQLFSSSTTGTLKILELGGTVFRLLDASGTVDFSVAPTTGGAAFIGSSAGANCGNYWQIAGRPNGQTVLMTAQGCSDTNVGIQFGTKGTGIALFKPGTDADFFKVQNAAGTSTYLDVNTSTGVTTLGGNLGFTGTSSGTITLAAQAAAGTYNWEWPITAGTAGQVLTSQGGGSTAMTWTNSSTLSIPTGTATFAPGTGVTSVACASGFSCNNTRGTLTIVGGTATTGTIATVSFSAALSAAPACFASMNGGGTLFSIGNSAPSTTAFTISAGISILGATFNVNYQCQP